MDPSDFSCTWLNKEEIWEIADEKRNTFWPRGTLPVDVEEIIELGLRLSVEPEHGLLQGADIDAFLKTDLSGFFIDREIYENSKYENRRRFSYAHELGHLFLHDYIYKRMNFMSYKEWKEFIHTISEKEYVAFEFQANEFAGRFLVPREELIVQIDRAVEVLKKEDLSHLVSDYSDMVQPYLAKYIHGIFGVSEWVIERRLEREELWPPKK